MLKKMFAVMLLTGLMGVTAQAGEIKTEGVMCPVAKTRAVNPDKSAEYNGAKVFFCCGKCQAAFKKNPEKFTERANHQLVATGQAKQKACPFTGGGAKDSKSVEVLKVKVNFCCGNCEGKASKMSKDEQLTAIFGEKGFEKGFEVKTEK